MLDFKKNEKNKLPNKKIIFSERCCSKTKKDILIWFADLETQGLLLSE